MDRRRPSQTSILPLQTTSCAQAGPSRHLRSYFLIHQLKTREGLDTSAVMDELVGVAGQFMTVEQNVIFFCQDSGVWVIVWNWLQCNQPAQHAHHCPMQNLRTCSGGQQRLEQTHHLGCKLSTGEATSKEGSKLEATDMRAVILKVWIDAFSRQWVRRWTPAFGSQLGSDQHHLWEKRLGMEDVLADDACFCDMVVHFSTLV